MYALSGHEFSSEYSVSLHFEIGILRKKKKKMVRIYNEVFFQFYFVKPVSQPLRGMELQEKEAEKDAKNIVKLIIKSPKRKSAY